MEKPKLYVLAGPTASGKSGAALAVAQRLPVEIVSADSMQVYRGMDIGTAKATARERAHVPHHMLDVCDLWQEYTVSQYREAALRAMEGIYARGKTPLLVGGTGLYINAILDGLNFAGEAGRPDVRRKWETYLASHGAQATHDKLSAIDPVTAVRLHPNNTRRVIRALEVYELTGMPISQRAKTNAAAFDVRYAALRMDREKLNDRINRRVAGMMHEGLVAEARRVYDSGGNTARQAIGYKQLFPFFEGSASLKEAEDAIALATRQYAKRQMTWFVRDERIHWFEAESSALEQDLIRFYQS